MWPLLGLLLFGDWAAIERNVAAGKFREALAQLEASGERPTVWHVLASKVYDGLNDPRRAVEEAESALAIEPRNEAAHLQLGVIFLARHTPMAALEVYREAEDLFPDSLPVRLGKGLAFKELQVWDEAESVLERCWPNPIAFDALATIYLHRKKFDEARTLSRRFIKHAVNDFRGWYFLAAAEDGLLQSPGEVKKLIGEAVGRNPRFAASHALLGKVLLREGKAEQAVAALGRAVELRPDLTQAHLHLAQAFQQLGRAQQASHEFAVVRELKLKEAQPFESLKYGRRQK